MPLIYMSSSMMKISHQTKSRFFGSNPMTELPSPIHRCKILCSAENHVGSVDVRGVLCILNSHLISLNRLQSMLAAHNLMVSKDTSVVLPIRSNVSSEMFGLLD
ncbi:Uncharacterized protein TCM_029581 [Theobroma cacao]|uniref:Uncharacterized protein n=1 Tax=Theobroma cacao TaxID=3641 RepID=A0A061GE37_THECC|nr:Uncharacterized protein TCM_029581 [Theobroma cacao]